MRSRIPVLSLVMPVHNESESILIVLEEWNNKLRKFVNNFEFVICEDGSTDGTQRILKGLQRKYPMILDSRKERRGYGAAVIDGIKASRSEYILCIDSDGQCDPADFENFWGKRNPAEVIIGHRIIRMDSLNRKIFSGAFHMVFNLLFPTRIHDPSAPYVFFAKSKIVPHVSDLKYLQEGFWWGFVGTCVKNNIAVKDLPINHRARFAGGTTIYQARNLGRIAVRNLCGLLRLRLSA